MEFAANCVLAIIIGLGAGVALYAFIQNIKDKLK